MVVSFMLFEGSYAWCPDQLTSSPPLNTEIPNFKINKNYFNNSNVSSMIS